MNEVFSASLVSQFYSLSASIRSDMISQDRFVNYGVVRLSLLEQLYEKMYMQRVRNSNEREWRCRILGGREVGNAKQIGNAVSLKLGRLEGLIHNAPDLVEEVVEADYVFAATGYKRDVHDGMLEDLRVLLPSTFAPMSNGHESNPALNEMTNGHEKLNGGPGRTPVNRDYRVPYDENQVDASEAGIWIQGCCEETHGVCTAIPFSVLIVFLFRMHITLLTANATS